jgi:Fe-S oxidoreductase
MNPTFEKYWNIPGYVILYFLFIVALMVFFHKTIKLYGFLRLGEDEDRFDHFGKRIKLFFTWILGGWCTLRGLTRKDFAGIGHFIMIWTFIIFFINYAYLFIWGAWHKQNFLTELGNAFSSSFSILLDFLALITLGTIIWALSRRYFSKPERLERGLEPAIILFLIFLLTITHFIGEGFRISTVYNSGGGPISLVFAGIFKNFFENNKQTFYYAAWWFHILVLLSFMVYIPYSKHLHIIAAMFNVIFSHTRPQNALIPINIETGKTFGAEKIEDFSWKQLLDLYACAECGRCRINCPAYLSGKTLSPQQMIKSLKNHLIKKGMGVQNNTNCLIGETMSEDKIWDCLTCYACQEVCPVRIEHVDKIVGLRRNLVLMKSHFFPEIGICFRNVETFGDTFGQGRAYRENWLSGVDVPRITDSGHADILYWVGCQGSFHGRASLVAASLANLFKKAGIDFAILGKEEICCGDPVRRIGNEYLFQKIAKRNIELLNHLNIKKIVTYCPHCFSMLKNEYPQLGGHFKVIHYTEFLRDLIKGGHIKIIKEMENKVVFHDPCSLARANDIHKGPREILKSIPGVRLTEPGHSKRQTLCCGAGGGHMWMREGRGRKINEMRVEELLDTKPEIIATSCPYCLVMFEDGVKSLGIEGIKCVDIIEIIRDVI